jgi:hypothetical protein
VTAARVPLEKEWGRLITGRMRRRMSSIERTALIVYNEQVFD